MVDKKCWICESQATSMNNEGVLHYDCTRCGRYRVDKNFSHDNKFTDSRLIANVSGWIFENQDFLFNESVFKRLSNLITPTVNDRAEKFLHLLESKTEFLGQKIDFNFQDKKLCAASWVANENELQYLINYLIQRKLISLIGILGSGFSKVEILPDGFIYLEDLNKKIRSNIGFCAMSFDPKMLSVWGDAISPAIASAGYKPVRIDSEQFNTGIVDQIKASIRQAKFVVADLTLHRNGVYYEAGFADGLGCDVIFTCREDEFEKSHFDVLHINIIKWSPDNYDDFRINLCNRIEGTLGKGEVSLET